MSIGRIQAPNLDDRTWKDIVDEMIHRIPEVAPEWTDHNPSDPGITLIELFAWMAEMMIYRLNKVPEKHYITLLNLLDITRDPPTPAKVKLTFNLSAEEVIIPKGTQISTVPTEKEDAIVFETDKEKRISKTDNKITATNALTIKQPEIIGYGTGEKYQVYALKNSPLYAEPGQPDPFSHLQVRIAEKMWTRVNDFKENQNEHYRCNPVTGEISFGDGNMGGIPPKGAEIVVAKYRYVVGGIKSNVAPSSLSLLKVPIAGVKSVINEQIATGGSDWENIEDTLRRAPKQIKSISRAVTKEDYEFWAKEATNEVGKVRCLGPKKIVGGGYETEPLDRQLGNVNLLLIPNVKYEENKLETRMPVPSEELLNNVKTYLDSKRTLTSILYVSSPHYVEIGIEATVYIPDGEDKNSVVNELRAHLINFLHPVSGGKNNTGWEIGQDIYIPEIFDIINTHSKVSFIEALKIKKIGGSASEGVRVEIQEHEVVCAADPDPGKNNFDITAKYEESDI